jgi:hypothetical protein
MGAAGAAMGRDVAFWCNIFNHGKTVTCPLCQESMDNRGPTHRHLVDLPARFRRVISPFGLAGGRRRGAMLRG